MLYKTACIYDDTRSPLIFFLSFFLVTYATTLRLHTLCIAKIVLVLRQVKSKIKFCISWLWVF